MDTLTLQTLRERYERFAQADGRDDALYCALATEIAQDEALLALAAQAPPTQHLPVLLLAALHLQVLKGADHGLARYYASVTPQPAAPDAQLASALRRFVAAERPALDHTLATRRTQTNEIGRSAVLWAALQVLAQRSGHEHFALYDFGCSAGLNLGVADYSALARDDHGQQWRYGSAAADAPELPIHWQGHSPALLRQAQAWRLSPGRGCDLAPLQPSSSADTLWLQACLWPGDGARRTRLQRALALAQQRRDPLLQHDDGLSDLAHWAPTLESTAGAPLPVLFHSWVLAYFDTAAAQAHHERALQLVRDTGLAWISAEAPARSPIEPLPPLPPGESPGSATLWVLHWRDAHGTVQRQALAWSHPHGRWARAVDPTLATSPAHQGQP
ncbi:DUF2332 family protein [Roseateles sp. BYS180W]|uniref:DUF2332 family protein n=1 Tax=Roseateles rivi TaxID=3299028 RepID=A0ABW7FUC7_9BURK